MSRNSFPWNAFFVDLLVAVFCILFIIALLTLLPGCSTPAYHRASQEEKSQIGIWSATHIGNGYVYQWNTATGEGHILLPQGTIHMGTPDQPRLEVTPRASDLKLEIETEEPSLERGLKLMRS